MQFELIILSALFITYSVIKEVLHFKQVSKLEELLKSLDINDYYQAKSKTSKSKNKNENTVLSGDPNPIAYEDPEFDLKKIEEVFIDGKKIPIDII